MKFSQANVKKKRLQPFFFNKTLCRRIFNLLISQACCLCNLQYRISQRKEKSLGKGLAMNFDAVFGLQKGSRKNFEPFCSYKQKPVKYFLHTLA